MRAVERNVLKTIRVLQTATPEEVFRRLNWWTLETIEETFAELRRDGVIRFGPSTQRYWIAEGC